jgi:demethylmenaquinone methyltransferase / 2-methoxy-6-polyprenyl-1,4-benzoquinol methylase
MTDNTDTTDFGFRRVPRADKRGMVRAVFDSVAPRYDLMNDLMSLGVHRAWKRVLITALDPSRRRHRGCRSGLGGAGWWSATAERR